MQAIYEAILLIPQSPSEATKILCKIARVQPHFLEYLRTMAVQLYDRFAPQSQLQHDQYQKISKQLLAVFNRFVNIAFRQKGNDIYLNIESYYQWTIEILLCDHISLTSKKALVSSLTQIINSICYQPDRMTSLIDHMMQNSMKSSSSVFIYLECLLSSSVQQVKIVTSIRQSYQFLYYVALSEYESLVNFYKNKHMEMDIGQISPNSNFLQRLNENQYILLQLHKIFKLIESIYEKKRSYSGLESLTTELFFHPDIAKYLSLFLKIQKDLFNSFQRPNMYGLKFIVMTNLKATQKNVINIQKSLCLSILKIILSLTDKGFNIACTDKLLMKELFNLSELIINELMICSQPNVIKVLSTELQITTLISSMLGLLSVIIEFQDLKQAFQSMNIEKLIRLTFFYSKTFEEEMNLYFNNSEEYFYFNYYICDNPNKQEDIQIQSIEEFCIRERVVDFIRSMNNKVEGYHNIVMDICCDIIKLQMRVRKENNMEYKQMFLEKYSLNQEILGCFDLESALSVFTILIQNSWDRHEKVDRMYYLLKNIELNLLNKLQLYRMYICLSINHSLFIFHKGHKLFYNFIEKVYNLDNKQCSVTHAGYYFIERLLSKQIDGDQDYDDVAQKILNELIQLFSNAKCIYPFQIVQDSIKITYISRNIVSLGWIIRSLTILNHRIANQIDRSHDEVFKHVLSLYVSLISAAEQKIIENRSLAYPTFQNECAEYFDQVLEFINAAKFQYFERILRQKEPMEDDDAIIVSFSTVLLQMLIQQIPMSNEQSDLILNFTLSLFSRDENCDEDIKKIRFQLLYQLIHIKIFTFDEKIHHIILTWMQQNYYRSEVSLNRICVILQQLYYYIDNNINQNQANFLYFYSSIIQILEKKFLELLFEYHNYVEALQEEIDINIKKINQIRINFDPNVNVKTNPITIIRLYNTILLNPYFDVTIIRKIHQMIRKYNFQIIPTYDLTMQVLSLESLMKRSKNISVFECFRFTTELLGYNCKHSELKCRQNTQIQREIAHLTQGLRTSLTLIDPYEAYCILIEHYVFKPQQPSNFLSQDIDGIEINIMNFLSNDKYLLNLVKKLTLIRNVNNRTRMIIRIKKDNV